MKNFIIKIVETLKNRKIVNNDKKISEKQEEPMVYINKPISNFEEDVLGVKTYVDRIDKAIKDEANVIGVIGDYGTGKSSLIELLKNKYPDSININMWNNTYSKENNENPNEKSIKNLTKNFLFQMAMGDGRQFAQYINKKLSKNYGILSIIKSGKHFWRYFILAIIFAGLYKIAEGLPIDIYDTSIYHSFCNCFGSGFFPDGLIQNIIILLYGVFIDFKIVLLIISILFLIKAILKTTIVFSLWDSQSKRTPDVNDLYDIYLEIAERITKKYSKRIIIIEDLDRTNKIEDIKEFIKEIYRFNDVLPEETRNKLIYIIEVKSEEAMEIIKEHLNQEVTGTKGTKETKKEKLYKKVFFFKVILNPIHNSDCEQILLELLKTNKKKLKEILGLDLENTLPNEFAYIVRGNNLTIRDLKERLNRSFEIYENLKYKGGETDATIDYKKCAIVAYLESKYPKKIKEFIDKEGNFTDVLEKSYIIKQNNKLSLTEKIEEIKSIINEKESDEFTDEIATLIANDLIDEDFRLYFYNYPKGQRIKSTEEEYVEKLILYPSQNKQIDDEKIRKAVEKNKEIVVNCYERRKKENLVFPRIIFENEILYKTALNRFYDKVVETLEKDIKWKAENRSESGKIIQKICDYEVDSKQILEEYASFLLNDFKQLPENEIIGARTEIIKASKKYLLCFKSIFVNDDIILITKDELNLIEDISIKLQLINEKIVDEKDLSVIINVLNSKRLELNDFKRATEIYYGIDETLGLANIPSEVLEFLTINKKIDDRLFGTISESFIQNRQVIDEGKLVKYLNDINVNDISEEYFRNIDDMKISKKLSEEILLGLKKRNQKKTLWINLILQGRVSELELEENLEENLIIIKDISNILGTELLNLRKEIIKRGLEVEYKSIFINDNPLITSEEIDMLQNIEQIKMLTNFEKLREEDIENLVKKINEIYITKEDLIKVIELFDKTKTVNNIKDMNLVKQFFSVFEWKNVEKLTDEQRSYIYRILKEPLRLTDNNYAIEFSYRIGYIIKEIDNQLYIQARNNENYYDEYTKLANKIDIPTEQTITNILNFSKECKLNANISAELWKRGYYSKSLVGKILWENKLDINHVKMNIDEYVKVYIQTERAHDIMANNNDFLQIILDEERYENIKNKNKLTPFYKLRQPMKFVKHIFEVLSDSDIYEYLKSPWELNTETDSMEFQKFICEDKYIKFIENQEVYEIIKFKLWKASHKSLLTKARNKKFDN